MEYAIEAIKLGSTAIGICTSEGVVLAVEKRITSALMEPTTVEKIVEIDKHIGKSVDTAVLSELCLIGEVSDTSTNNSSFFLIPFTSVV